MLIVMDADLDGVLGFHDLGGKIPRPVAADEDLRRVLPDFVAHTMDWPLSDNIPSAQQDDLIRDGIDFVKNMARNNHVTTVCRRRPKQSDHLGASQRVEAVQRLVQDQNSRIVTQGLSEPDSLTHSFAISGDVAVCGVGKIYALNRAPSQTFRGL